MKMGVCVAKREKEKVGVVETEFIRHPQTLHRSSSSASSVEGSEVEVV